MQKLQACEVAVKHYAAGDREARHFHKVSTEITLILSGTVRMNGQEWSAGDVVVLDPGEPTDFLALTDSVSVVVKTPSVREDKYFCEDGLD
jgi:quercetin dioxygenase-like cupin family protein